MKSKDELYDAGVRLVAAFCKKNNLPTPEVFATPVKYWVVGPCAYYRENAIHICIAKCAHIGVGGPAWSYPGYIVDRTPYGVLAHECGHHVDRERGQTKGKYWSEYGPGVCKDVAEEPLTGYCPNPAEWFAEMMRLFITNPDLLRAIRPKTHARLILDGLKPVEERIFERVLEGAPTRTLAMAHRRAIETGAVA